MTPKKLKTRSVSRERHSTYLKKAKEFSRASELSMRIGAENRGSIISAWHAEKGPK